MKWLFFILLLANLGMFLLIYPQQAEKKVGNGLPDVGELYLYEEVEAFQTDLSAAEESVLIDEEMTESDMDVVEESVLADEDVSESDISVAEETLLTGEEVSDADLMGESTDDGMKGEQPEQAFELASDLSIDEPVSEATSGQAETSAEPEGKIADTDMIEEPATAEPPVCRTIGYLESRSDAEILSVSLRAMGLKPELQSETIDEQAGVWVLIPPQASRSKAVEITRRLERDGVSDIWRFTSGDLVHAISLGLFRNEQRAETRKKQIAALGYDVIVKPRFRQKTKYWLYYQVVTSVDDNNMGWNDLFAKYPDIEVEETACH
ncbi:MAG: hypothetical protein PVJ68_11665 [Candidatus Thiodiazotropha sp.]|jgi:hypothetical protein